MIERDSLPGASMIPVLTVNSLLVIAMVMSATAVVAEGVGGSDALSDLKALNIQELLDVPVTSVTRRPQKASDAAAALFVISREDIRRSAATSIPELLRMVPGLQVARIDSSKWAISARGFNSRYANKLLVQLDGRTLYTPLYSGVYWDVQDTLLEDIERIEIIRGPGATLWGSNAVNGIINIITRSAHETGGGLLSLGAGNERRWSAGMRYGDPLGEDGSYRIYAKGFEQNAGLDFTGESANDAWVNRRAGFRLDTDFSQSTGFTLQSDYYQGDADATVVTGPLAEEVSSETSGLNLLARISQRLASDAGLELQFYVDRTERDSWAQNERRDTFDLDFQHHFNLSGNHELVWGLGYRESRDQITASEGSTIGFNPMDSDLTTYGLFLQDDISLAQGALHLIIGTKLERNDYTGWEVQPNLRGLWNIGADVALWAAVSRAVRTPSRVESDVSILSPVTQVSGNPEIESERVIAYEIGWRQRVTSQLSLDLAAFHNHYEKLQTIELVGPPVPPLVMVFGNAMQGDSYGVELSSNWDIARNWRLRAAYSWLEFDLELDPESTDMSSLTLWDRNPHHQLNLRSFYDLRRDLELDASLYYVDELSNSDVPSYLRFDLRLGWRPRPGLELSLVGTNLLDDSHPEFVEFSGNRPGEGLRSTQEQRSLLAQARLSF